MKYLQYTTLFCILYLSQAQKLIKEFQKSQGTVSFTFGSCNRADYKPSEIFREIGQQHSDVFVWLGDVAYVDYRLAPFIWVPDTEENVKNKFQISYNDPYYSEFRKKQKILGVYDDHDLNKNDADINNPNKEMARQLFLDFIDEPKDSQRRQNPNGIYESYYMGDNRAKLILLDVRFNRDTKKGDSLGNAQWEWLENELKDENPFIFFIGSGVQVFPGDRISENILKRVIFLSGDIHIGEILYEPCSEEYLGYPLMEFTSSGLNVLRGEFIQFLTIIYDGILPDTYSQPWDRFIGQNYGKVNIEWAENFDDSIISIEIYENGNIETPQLQKYFKLGQMDVKQYDDNLQLKCEILEKSPQQRFIEKCLSHFIEGNIIVWIFFILISVNIILVLVLCVLCCIGRLYQYRLNRKLDNKQKQE